MTLGDRLDFTDRKITLRRPYVPRTVVGSAALAAAVLVRCAGYAKQVCSCSASAAPPLPLLLRTDTKLQLHAGHNEVGAGTSQLLLET